MTANEGPDLFDAAFEKSLEGETDAYKEIMRGLRGIERTVQVTNAKIRAMFRELGVPVPDVEAGQTLRKKSPALIKTRKYVATPSKAGERHSPAPPATTTPTPNAMPKIAIAPDVLEVLKKATATGNVLTLNQPNLERKLYLATNTVLEAAGGKWDKKAKGHVFPGDPFEKLGISLDTGSIEKALTDKTVRQAFYTPAPLADRLAMIAGCNGKTVLEPSAGGGALVRACLNAGARSVECVEIDPASCAGLRAKSKVTSVLCADFLTIPPGVARTPYDRVVMNPPFTDRAEGKRGLHLDVKHVRHALGFLASDGVLVAITGGNRQRKPFEDLLRDVTANGWTYDIEDVSAGAFKESGTGVSTLILTVRK